MFMLGANLFRALHPLRAHDAESFDLDEEEPALEPAWPHLQVRARAARRSRRPVGGAGGGACRARRRSPPPGRAPLTPSWRPPGPRARRSCTSSCCATSSPPTPTPRWPSATSTRTSWCTCWTCSTRVRAWGSGLGWVGEGSWPAGLLRPLLGGGSEPCGAPAGPGRLGRMGNWGAVHGRREGLSVRQQGNVRRPWDALAACRAAAGRASWAAVPCAPPRRGPARARLPQDDPAPHLRCGGGVRSRVSWPAAAPACRACGADAAPALDPGCCQTRMPPSTPPVAPSRRTNAPQASSWCTAPSSARPSTLSSTASSLRRSTTTASRVRGVLHLLLSLLLLLLLLLFEA